MQKIINTTTAIAVISWHAIPMQHINGMIHVHVIYMQLEGYESESCIRIFV